MKARTEKPSTVSKPTGAVNYYLFFLIVCPVYKFEGIRAEVSGSRCRNINIYSKDILSAFSI